MSDSLNQAPEASVQSQFRDGIEVILSTAATQEAADVALEKLINGDIGITPYGTDVHIDLVDQKASGHIAWPMGGGADIQVGYTDDEFTAEQVDDVVGRRVELFPNDHDIAA